MKIPKVKFVSYFYRSDAGNLSNQKKHEPIQISIIGAGNVGMSCAFSILQKPNCCSELVLIDLDERKVKGEVLDLQNGAVFLSGVKIRGGTEYSLMHSSDIVIVTAGARKIAGESMENLISKNVQNMRTIMCAISRMAPKSAWF